MTRKHKPHTAHKKRPSSPSGKPAKSSAADKTVAAVASLREKDRARSAAAPRKTPLPVRPVAGHARLNDARPTGTRAAGKSARERRPLRLERQAPAMPQARPSPLKPLLAPG